jgi:hypothetical protein
VAVVEGALTLIAWARTTAMIVVGLILPVFAVGLTCWLVFALAVRALAFYAGIAAMLFATCTGAGAIGAIIVGLCAGAATDAFARLAFAITKSSLPRAVIAFVVVAPAVFAGYHATVGLCSMAIPSNAWRLPLALLGALLVGGAALSRLAGTSAPPGDRRAAAARSAQSESARTTR